jgi:hypothetical protein
MGNGHADHHDDPVLAMAKTLAGFSPAQLSAYRAELAAAPADDPDIHRDRDALRLFELMRTTGGSAWLP